MITIPSIRTLPNVRHYRDSSDPQILYVDIRSPAPVQRGSGGIGAARAGLNVPNSERSAPHKPLLRWFPLPDQDFPLSPSSGEDGSSAYMVGEVQFGPGPEDVSRLPIGPDHASDPVSGSRMLPMPWEPSAVYAWYHDGEGSRLVAQGQTSGYGASNAVLNGIAPLRAMAAELQISAELFCKCRLSSGHVRGAGRVKSIEAALPRAVLGSRASWDAMLGESLVALLAELLKTGDLSLEIEAGSFGPEGQAELQEIALFEWARRLIDGREAKSSLGIGAGNLSLALPAGQVDELRLPAGFHLDLNWQAGAFVPLRAVRRLRAAAR